MSFDHFVITRFNVRIKDARNAPASEDWLRHRLQYFEKVCCPSLRSQTRKQFRWIVLFDSERPDWFEDEINRLASGLFEPVWINGLFTPTGAARLTAERSTADWLITSRVDNDDALARDYITSVQAAFAGRTEFINFQAGLQLTDDGQLFHRLDPSNAFISLIEKRHEDLGVYHLSHDQALHFGKVRQVKAHPIWLQMIHGRNIGNHARGVRADHRLLDRYFSVDVSAEPISRPALLAGQARSAATLGWRVIQKPSRVAWLGRVVRNAVG